MEAKWTIESLSDFMSKPCVNVDQIQGAQTLLTNNLFGVKFRIMEIGRDEYSINEEDIGISPFYETMRKIPEFEDTSNEIKEKLAGRWNKDEVAKLLEFGLIGGICKKLEAKDKELGTNSLGKFLQNEGIKKMQEIENERKNTFSFDGISNLIKDKSNETRND